MRAFLLILFVFTTLIARIEAQKSNNEAGVIVRAGLFTTILDGATEGRFFSNSRNGYAFGVDGHLVDGHVIFMPGLHLITIPETSGNLSDGLSKIIPEDNFGVQIPVRIGLHVLNTHYLKIKIAGGAYGVYFLDKMIGREINKQYNTRVHAGWNGHVGFLFKQISLDFDYNRSFGKLQQANQFKMNNMHITIGFKL